MSDSPFTLPTSIMDPAQQTLVTFRMFNRSAISVSLFGSWDNFSRPYQMQSDKRRGKGEWMGCFAFEDIICDGDPTVSVEKRSGGLKQGGQYWYFYQLDGGEEYFNPAEPSTSACPLLPGQRLNVLEVPEELLEPHGTVEDRTEFISLPTTLDPNARFATPQPPRYFHNPRSRASDRRKTKSMADASHANESETASHQRSVSMPEPCAVPSHESNVDQEDAVAKQQSPNTHWTKKIRPVASLHTLIRRRRTLSLHRSIGNLMEIECRRHDIEKWPKPNDLDVRQRSISAAENGRSRGRSSFERARDFISALPIRRHSSLRHTVVLEETEPSEDDGCISYPEFDAMAPLRPFSGASIQSSDVERPKTAHSNLKELSGQQSKNSSSSDTSRPPSSHKTHPRDYASVYDDDDYDSEAGSSVLDSCSVCTPRRPSELEAVQFSPFIQQSDSPPEKRVLGAPTDLLQSEHKEPTVIFPSTTTELENSVIPRQLSDMETLLQDFDYLGAALQ